jgi:hypothetical protein
MGSPPPSARQTHTPRAPQRMLRGVICLRPRPLPLRASLRHAPSRAHSLGPEAFSVHRFRDAYAEPMPWVVPDGGGRCPCDVRVSSVLSTRAMRVGGGGCFRLARVQGPSSSPPSAGAMCSYALPLHNAHPPSVAPRPPYHNRLIALKNSRVPNCRRSHPPTLCSTPQAL